MVRYQRETPVSVDVSVATRIWLRAESVTRGNNKYELPRLTDELDKKFKAVHVANYSKVLRDGYCTRGSAMKTSEAEILSDLFTTAPWSPDYVIINPR